jgi:hypothetical protein
MNNEYMTKAVEQFVAQLSRLPEARQDEYAAMFLAELEDELKWDASFAKSRDQLSSLAAEALAEHRRGETKPLMENGEFTKD